MGIAVQFAGKANASDRWRPCCAAMSCTVETPARKFSANPAITLRFRQSIKEASVRVPVPLLVYCLLSNHFHLVVRPRADRNPSRWSLIARRARSNRSRNSPKPLIYWHQ